MLFHPLTITKPLPSPLAALKAHMNNSTEHYESLPCLRKTDFKLHHWSASCFKSEKDQQLFAEYVAKGSRFTLGIWESWDVFVRGRFHVRNRSQPSAMRSPWLCLWGLLQKRQLLDVSNVAQPRFVWQAWHFVTFSRVWKSIERSFCATITRLLQGFQKMSCTRFCGRRSTLILKVCHLVWIFIDP